MIKDNIIFQITEEDVQDEAMARIGRKLTEDEMCYAIKGIRWGLGDIPLILTYDTIFNEMIQLSTNNEN